MNLARQKPALYATYVEDLRLRYNGGSVVLAAAGPKWRMKEGLSAIDEAVRFLRAAPWEQPLTLSPGMCRAAADHCVDQGGGRTGHAGSDRSAPSSRLSRYGIWTGPWGENIAYGKTTPREIVLALVIDDGHPARPHRRNIFNPNFNYAGAACGPHARYGSVCTINFAGSYVGAERYTCQDVCQMKPRFSNLLEWRCSWIRDVWRLTQPYNCRGLFYETALVTSPCRIQPQ
jgi:hypothetical protein